MTPVPVPIHIPMAVLTLPTLTGAHPPAGFGAGGLQPGECCNFGLVWECVPYAATLVPACCPHAAAIPCWVPVLLGEHWEARGARVETAASTLAPVPAVSKGS